MKQKDQNTAILIFAEKAATASRKDLLGNDRENLILHQNLLTHTLETAKNADLPIIWMHEELQRGHNFGARLLNAMEEVFEMGYEQIIVVGSDTPQLTPNHIRSAKEKLMQSPLVLGPSNDGGIYLLAIRRSHFDTFRKMKIVWQEGRDYRDIIYGWTKLGESFTTFSELQDVDTSRDLFRLKSKLQHAGLYASLFSIPSCKQPLQYENISFLLSSIPNSHYLRAPPHH